MKTFSTAYVKTINGIPFYFVKTYHSFPEYKDVPPVLETYGMHTSFKKACNIAQVTDPAVQQHLLNDIENKAAACKVIPLQTATSKIYNLKRRNTSFPSILKLLGFG
jgi:hypothetical protein